MIKIIQVTGHSAEFSHPDFKLSLFRRADHVAWGAYLLVTSGPKEVQQLRLDLAEKLERIASILRSQEAAIIKTVAEAI